MSEYTLKVGIGASTTLALVEDDPNSQAKIPFHSDDFDTSGAYVVVKDSGVDHGGLGGLSDDDHTQYVLLAGRSGGQVVLGGTASGDDLIMRTTSNETKGHFIFLNDTHEDTDGGRENILTFRGEKGDGTAHNLAQIQVSHDGTGDDHKGKLEILVNDGDDGDSPSLTPVTIGADGLVTLANGLTSLAGTTSLGALDVTGTSRFGGNIGIGVAPDANTRVNLLYGPINDTNAHCIYANFYPKATSNGSYVNNGMYLRLRVKADNGITNTGYANAIHIDAHARLNFLSGTISLVSGLSIGYGNYDATGTITEANGIRVIPYIKAGTIGTSTAIKITASTTGGTCTTHYGLYVGNQAGATTNWAIYQTGSTGPNAFNAKTRIGSVVAPTVELDVTGDTILDGEVTINESGADKDFRVEGNGLTHLLFCDAGVDTVSIGASVLDATGRNVLAILNGTAPSAAVADTSQLWSEDIVAGKASVHMYPESADGKHTVCGVYTKTDTGNPTQTIEGMICINTNDNTVKIYADGGWRTIDSGW